MKAITVRNIPMAVVLRLRRSAAELGLRCNQVVLRLLKRSLGVASPRRGTVSHDDLDDLIGSMSGARARELDAAIAEQQAIDEKLRR